MKRCPQCQFIYLDSDELCDFDQTTLAVVADSGIDAASHVVEGPALAELAAAHASAINRRIGRKGLPIAAAAGLTLGVVLFGFYFKFSHRAVTAPAAPITNRVDSRPVAPLTPANEATPLPSVEASPEPSPSVAPRVTPSPSRVSTAHSSGGSGPVSTGNDSAQKATGTKPIIVLTTGGRVEADEVWQTKDGVWYRANGMVTLLKRNRVKSIVRR